MRKSVLLLSLMAVSGLAAAEAYQVDEYGYVGIDAGRSVLNSPYAGQTGLMQFPIGVAVVGTLGDADLAYKAFAGYQFNPWYSVEVYYADLGKINGYGTLISPIIAPGTATLRNTGYGIDGGLDLPFWDEATFMIKLGAFRSTTVLDIANTTGTYHAGGSRSKTSFKYGLGLKVKVSDQFGVRGMFESYRNLGDANTIGTGSVNTYTLGGFYKF